MSKRWINTKVEFIWDGSQYVEQSAEGYWYEGEMALADLVTPTLMTDFAMSSASATAQGSTLGTLGRIGATLGSIWQGGKSFMQKEGTKAVMSKGGKFLEALGSGSKLLGLGTIGATLWGAHKSQQAARDASGQAKKQMELIGGMKTDVQEGFAARAGLVKEEFTEQSDILGETTGYKMEDISESYEQGSKDDLVFSGEREKTRERLRERVGAGYQAQTGQLQNVLGKQLMTFAEQEASQVGQLDYQLSALQFEQKGLEKKASSIWENMFA